MLSSEWDCIGLQTFHGFVVEIICFPLADKHLGGDGVPRFELQITLGQKVTVVGVVNRLDAAFHVGNQGIVLLLRILDVLLQCHDFENCTLHFAVVGGHRSRHIADAAAVHALCLLMQQVNFRACVHSKKVV